MPTTKTTTMSTSTVNPNYGITTTTTTTTTTTARAKQQQQEEEIATTGTTPTTSLNEQLDQLIGQLSQLKSRLSSFADDQDQEEARDEQTLFARTHEDSRLNDQHQSQELLLDEQLSVVHQDTEKLLQLFLARTTTTSTSRCTTTTTTTTTRLEALMERLEHVVALQQCALDLLLQRRRRSLAVVVVKENHKNETQRNGGEDQACHRSEEPHSCTTAAAQEEEESNAPSWDHLDEKKDEEETASTSTDDDNQVGDFCSWIQTPFVVDTASFHHQHQHPRRIIATTRKERVAQQDDDIEESPHLFLRSSSSLSSSSCSSSKNSRRSYTVTFSSEDDDTVDEEDDDDASSWECHGLFPSQDEDDEECDGLFPKDDGDDDDDNECESGLDPPNETKTMTLLLECNHTNDEKEKEDGPDPEMTRVPKNAVRRNSPLELGVFVSNLIAATTPKGNNSLDTTLLASTLDQAIRVVTGWVQDSRSDDNNNNSVLHNDDDHGTEEQERTTTHHRELLHSLCRLRILIPTTTTSQLEKKVNDVEEEEESGSFDAFDEFSAMITTMQGQQQPVAPPSPVIAMTTTQMSDHAAKDLQKQQDVAGTDMNGVGVQENKLQAPRSKEATSNGVMMQQQEDCEEEDLCLGDIGSATGHGFHREEEEEERSLWDSFSQELDRNEHDDTLFQQQNVAVKEDESNKSKTRIETEKDDGDESCLGDLAVSGSMSSRSSQAGSDGGNSTIDSDDNDYYLNHWSVGMMTVGHDMDIEFLEDAGTFLVPATRDGESDIDDEKEEGQVAPGVKVTQQPGLSLGSGDKDINERPDSDCLFLDWDDGSPVTASHVENVKRSSLDESAVPSTECSSVFSGWSDLDDSVLCFPVETSLARSDASATTEAGEGNLSASQGASASLDDDGDDRPFWDCETLAATRMELPVGFGPSDREPDSADELKRHVNW